MKNNRLFEIITLQDNYRLADPISVLLAGIPSLLNLFVKTELTLADLNTIFPGQGTWTVALKNYLKKNIKWKDDKLPANIDLKMKAFINENFRVAKCSDIPSSCWRPFADTRECPDCTARFFKVLEQEKTGITTEAKYPGGLYGGSFNIESLLPIAAIGVALVLIMKKKKKNRK